jgi:hypothetical protein
MSESPHSSISLRVASSDFQNLMILCDSHALGPRFEVNLPVTAQLGLRRRRTEAKLRLSCPHLSALSFLINFQFAAN